MLFRKGKVWAMMFPVGRDNICGLPMPLLMEYPGMHYVCTSTRFENTRLSSHVCRIPVFVYLGIVMP